MTVRAHFVSEAKELANEKYIKAATIPSPCTELIEKSMFHGNWQKKLLSSDFLGQGQFVFGDPMYAQYYRSKDGRFQSGRNSTSPMISVSDNNTAKDGLKMAVETITLASPLVREGGVLCLCQAGMATDRWEVVKAAEDMDWICFDTIDWLKDQLAPREYESYGCGKERLLMFRRENEPLIDYSNKRLPMGDCLFCPSVTNRVHSDIRAGRRQPGQVFYMQKPLGLCEYLVLKHSRPGDLCIDLFGGSGSFSIAAMKHDRQWLYCESNDQPFNLARSRLLKAAEGRWDDPLLIDYPTPPRKYEFPPTVVNVMKALREYKAPEYGQEVKVE